MFDFFFLIFQTFLTCEIYPLKSFCNSSFDTSAMGLLKYFVLFDFVTACLWEEEEKNIFVTILLRTSSFTAEWEKNPFEWKSKSFLLFVAYVYNTRL